MTKRCLEKDPQRRLRDLGDADLALDLPATSAGVQGYPRWIIWTATTSAVIAVAIVAVLAFARLRIPRPPPPPLLQFEISPPVSLTESGTFSLSPDGRYLVFGGTGGDGIPRLWIRSFETLETKCCLS